MAAKRKADENLTGTRHPAARTDTAAGDDLAGTSAQTSGPTANAAGDGVSGISQALAGLTVATTGSAGRSSQSDGVVGRGPSGALSGQRGFAPPHWQAFTQFGGAARGAGGGSGYTGFSQPHGREPSQGILRPPVGNPAGERPPFPYQYHTPTGHGSLSGQTQNHAAGPRQTVTGQPASSLSGQTQNHVAGAAARGAGAGFFPGQNQIAGPLQTRTGQPQMPSQGMLRPPVGNPAGGRPSFTYQNHVPNGHGPLPSQNENAGPLQRGTGPPQMSSQGMLRPPLDNPAGGRPPFINQNHAPNGHGSLSGETQNHVAGPRQTGTGHPRGQSGRPGAPVSPFHRACPLCNRPTIVFWGLAPLCVDCYANVVLRDVLQKHPEIRHAHARPVPSYGGATQGQGIAIGHQQPSSAELARLAIGPGPWCGICLAATRRVYGSSPLCEPCCNLFVTGDVPPQHAQASHAGAPRGAAAIGPSSSSSSAVGSGPICQACGHLLGTGNRACRFCRSKGPPPPGFG